MKKILIGIVLLLMINFIFSFSVFGRQIELERKVKNNISAVSELEMKFKNYEEKQRKYILNTKQLVPHQVRASRNIRGIYVNNSAFKSKLRRERLIELVDNTFLNAIVVDIKNIEGEVIFSDSGIKKEKFKALMNKCQEKGIYVIGRLVVFKDYKLAEEDEYTLKYGLVNNSNVTINSSKWTSPYDKEVWDYNLEIADQAIQLGVDEIQFDYIRFPTLGKESKLVIKLPKNLSKADAIVGFLKYSREKLRKYDVLLSADVFGLTTTIKGDLGIGQDIVRMARYLDYISPMIYPSHYGEGIYGIKEPSSEPYKIISKSLSDAKKKLGVISYKLRPWLQDFSLKRIYTQKEIKAQIKAVEDKQLTGWLLWNPGSRYTIDALIDKLNEGG